MFFKWSQQIIRRHYRIVETYINMNMARSVYEYRRGGKCTYMFRYTYAGIREMTEDANRKERWA